MDDEVVVDTENENSESSAETVDMESIFDSVKKLIGPGEGDDYFDDHLILHINSAFSRLCQLGVGPKKPFKIRGRSEKWTDFLDDGHQEDVKDYVVAKVRKVFDPPENSFLMEALNEEIKELEWLLNSVAEVGY